MNQYPTFIMVSCKKFKCLKLQTLFNEMRVINNPFYKFGLVYLSIPYNSTFVMMGLFSLKVVLILIAGGKNQMTNGPVNAHLTSRLGMTNGPVNAHLISRPGISTISKFDLNLIIMVIYSPGVRADNSLGSIRFSKNKCSVN